MSAFPWDLVSPTSGVFAGSQVWLSLGLVAYYTSENLKWGSTPQDSGEALARKETENTRFKSRTSNTSLGIMQRNHLYLIIKAVLMNLMAEVIKCLSSINEDLGLTPAWGWVLSVAEEICYPSTQE